MTARAPAAAAIAFLLAACASTDYGAARETRFDRPYRGGAADVSDESPPPREAQPERPSDRDEQARGLALLLELVVGFTHGVDHVGPLPQDAPISSPTR